MEAASQDPERARKALAKLCELYRQPIVNWFRRHEFHDDPEDRAHDFLAYLLVNFRTNYRWQTVLELPVYAA